MNNRKGSKTRQEAIKITQILITASQQYTAYRPWIWISIFVRQKYLKYQRFLFSVVPHRATFPRIAWWRYLQLRQVNRALISNGNVRKEMSGEKNNIRDFIAASAPKSHVNAVNGDKQEKQFDKFIHIRNVAKWRAANIWMWIRINGECQQKCRHQK